jgi:hypothetical protein
MAEGEIDCSPANLMLDCVIKMGFKGRQFVALAMIFLPGVIKAAPVLAVASTNGALGMTVQVPVLLATDTNVLSARFDLRFNSKSLIVGAPAAGDATADHVIASSEVKRGTLRVQVNSFSGAELKDGVVVYVPMTISDGALAGKEDLVLTNVVLSSNTTNDIRPITQINGTVMITRPVHLSAVTNDLGHGVAAE